MPEHYDVIIIGTGAGGGTLAHTLAPSGKRILLLERGNFLPREMDNWDPEPVFIDGRYISEDTWYDADGKRVPAAGALLRRRRDQAVRRRAVPAAPAGLRRDLKHVDGVSPAWPLTYDDFEPWYTKAEWLYQVHGNHGEDPTEGPWSKQYPWPAVSHEPRIQQLSDDLQRAGYHPFHAPCGILLDEADRASSTCIRCTWCDGYPCLVHAKADAETIAVRPLLDLPNVTLLVDAEVLQLETDATGRTVTGSSCRATAPRRCTRPTSSWSPPGPSNRAKLLLRSANDHHPNGLANGSDQVGRNYMFHNCKAVVALSKEPQRHRLPEDPRDQRLLPRRRPTTMAGRQHPDGRQVERRAMKGEEPKLTKLAPHFGLADVAQHAVDFWLTTEDLPMPENRVTLDGDGNVHLAYTSTNDDEADRLYHELKKILNHVGHGRSTTCSTRTSTCTWTSRSPASRTRPARAGSAPTRRRRCSTPTARPTSSTTSTSSTRASSRASAR